MTMSHGFSLPSEPKLNTEIRADAAGNGDGAAVVKSAVPRH